MSSWNVGANLSELLHAYFRDPLLLGVVLLAPLLYRLASRHRAVLQYSSLAVMNRTPRTLRARLAILPAILLAVAAAALAVALAGPRTPDAETKISREGIAIMMVVDRSGSMNARDLVEEDRSVDRLTVVKDVFRQFVLGGGVSGKGRPDDMIGLISFARYADSQCPLTLDHGNLVAMLDDLHIVTREDEDGTAIGDGLALAVERLRQHKAKSKVVILLTDGVNNVGAIEPDQAADLAAAHDVKVYCVGAGTEGVAPVPARNPLTGRIGLMNVYVEIDEETLKNIADKTSGKYFRATDAEALTQIYREIDSLERTKVTEIRYMQYTELYPYFVVAGLGLIATAVVSNGTVFRRIP